MLHIAIVERESAAKEIVFQIGLLLHDYAWTFQHFTSLVDFVKQQQETSFEVVLLNDKFQNQRIYDSIIKGKNNTVIFTSSKSGKPIYTDTYFINVLNQDEMHEQLNEIIVPIVKRQEEFYFSYNNVNIMMKINDIQYIEKQDKFLVYHTKLGEFKRRGNMMDVVTYFQAFGFIHIHVSYLVNESIIFGLDKEYLILNNQKRLPISRSKYQAVKHFLNKNIH